MEGSRLQQHAFLLLVTGVSISFALVLLPFFDAVFWAMVLAIVFQPLQRCFRERLGRGRNLAALATLLTCLLLVILPLALLGSLLLQEGARAYAAIESGRFDGAAMLESALARLPEGLVRLLSRHGLTDPGALGDRLARIAGQGSRYLTRQAMAIGQDTVSFLTGLVVMLYLLFFLLRDGTLLADRIRNALPLPPAYRQKLLDRFTGVIRATFKGNFVVAGLQGALGGFIFAVLGIDGAALWGAVMAFLSLLPAIGAALVWGPVALYFLSSGALVKGIVLAAFGAGVIGLVDNLLRPLLVGKDTRMPDYVVLVSTLGGLALFGLSGFIIGPVIAGLFIVTWDLFTNAATEGGQD